MIYLDSCFVIMFVEGADARTQMVRSALRAAAPEQRFAISPLVVMECLVLPFREENLVREDEFRAIFAGFEKLPIPEEAYERAARLRASGRLKTPDALHLAIAQLGGCRELWTADAALAAASHGFARDVIGGGAGSAR